MVHSICGRESVHFYITKMASKELKRSFSLIDRIPLLDTLTNLGLLLAAVGFNIGGRIYSLATSKQMSYTPFMLYVTKERSVAEYLMGFIPGLGLIWWSIQRIFSKPASTPKLPETLSQPLSGASFPISIESNEKGLLSKAISQPLGPKENAEAKIKIAECYLNEMKGTVYFEDFHNNGSQAFESLKEYCQELDHFFSRHHSIFSQKYTSESLKNFLKKEQMLFQKFNQKIGESKSSFALVQPLPVRGGYIFIRNLADSGCLIVTPKNNGELMQEAGAANFIKDSLDTIWIHRNESAIFGKDYDSNKGYHLLGPFPKGAIILSYGDGIGNFLTKEEILDLFARHYLEKWESSNGFLKAAQDNVKNSKRSDHRIRALMPPDLSAQLSENHLCKEFDGKSYGNLAFNFTFLQEGSSK